MSNRTFHPIRRSTLDDSARLEAAARKFIARHATGAEDGYGYTTIATEDVCGYPSRFATVDTGRSSLLDLSGELDAAIYDQRYTRRLWGRCANRALGMTGARCTIAYGMVGYWDDQP